MRRIPIEEAVAILKVAEAVLIVGFGVSEVDLWDQEDDHPGVIGQVVYTDGDGVEYLWRFLVDDNPTVGVKGGALWFFNDPEFGECHVGLKPLQLIPLKD